VLAENGATISCAAQKYVGKQSNIRDDLPQFNALQSG
jgi:hypothetical protein